MTHEASCKHSKGCGLDPCPVSLDLTCSEFEIRKAPIGEVVPFFLPLRAHWFEQFRLGRKPFEWRRYLAPFTEATLYPGRRITLANGYGWPRLPGAVTSFEKLDACPNPAFDEIYPGWIAGGGFVSQIGIEITGPIQFKPRKTP
jgi:hypothetical protein